MIREIVSRERYRMSLDENKNRVYFEIWGDMAEPDLFKHFPADWRTTCSHVRPGFTILGDYSRTGVFFLKDIWKQAQEEIFKAGVNKVAVFWGKLKLGRWATEQSAEKASAEYLMRRRSFETREEAEAWLDEDWALSKMIGRK